MLKLKPIYSLLVFSTLIGFITAACIVCNSTDDINCIQGESITPINCMPINQTCFRRIVDGVTYRGCANTLPDSVINVCNTDTCDICTNIAGSSGCNRDLFPPHRSFCHICSGDEISNCAAEQIHNAPPCPLYELNDRCFILKRNTTESVFYQRGCVSSERSCNRTNNCFTCPGHGCNYQNVILITIPEHTPDPDPDSAMVHQTSILLSLTCLALIGSLSKFFN